jgi:hypothetical protein
VQELTEVPKIGERVLDRVDPLANEAEHLPAKPGGESREQQPPKQPEPLSEAARNSDQPAKVVTNDVEREQCRPDERARVLAELDRLAIEMLQSGGCG